MMTIKALLVLGTILTSLLSNQDPVGRGRPAPEVMINELTMRKAIVREVTPEYPSAAIQKRVTGVVVLAIHIDPSGSVNSVRVVQSPNQELGEAATKAVNQWKFSPVRAGRGPDAPAAGVETKLTFYFSIGNDGNPKVTAPTPPAPPSQLAVLESIGPDGIDSWLKTYAGVMIDSNPRELFGRIHDPRSINLPGDELEARGREFSTRAVLLDCRTIAPQLCAARSKIMADSGASRVGRVTDVR